MQDKMRKEICRLDSIADLWYKGQPFRKTDIINNGAYPCIHYGELFSKYGAIIDSVVSRCNTSPKRLSQTGDILFPASDVTPAGLARCSVILQDNVILGGDIIGLRPQGGLNPVYLSYAIRHQRRQLLQRVTGSLIKHISAKSLHSVLIPVHCIERQNLFEKQVRLLSSIIDHRHAQLTALNGLVKCRFVEMFGEHESWSKHDTIDLGRICNMISGGTPSSKHPEYFGGSIPFVSSPCLGPNYIDSSAAQNWLTELGVENSSTHIVPKYSLMVGNRVSVGKCSINTCAMCTNQDILSFVGIDTEKYDLLFVKKVIEQYEQFFETQKRGATIKGIPSEFVKASRIPLVSINIQREFASFVRRVDKLRFVIQKSLDETQMLFDSLMQDYFD